MKSFISVTALAAVTGLAASTASASPTPSLTGLGNLPGGFGIFAFGVSGDGSTVVGRGTSASGPEAFLWTAGGGMERLWDVLLAQGINPAASGWSVLTQANGVSLDGNTIVGYGIRDGNQEAFIAVIPSPSAAALLGLGGVLAARRWR